MSASFLPDVSGMVRVMAAVPKVHLANPAKNAEEIAALLDIADEKGASLCVFPELSLTGYTCGDLFFLPSLLQSAKDALDTLMQKKVAATYVVGLPMEIGGRLYNCAAVVSMGHAIIVPKTHIPDNSGFGERRWFSPGGNALGSVYLSDVPAENLRLATRPVINCGAFKLGIEICEDFWIPSPPSAELAMQGATIIANLSASNALAGKHAARREALKAHSARCMCGYVYSLPPASGDHR